MVPYSVFFANSSGIPFNHEAAHEILMHTIESSGTPCQASHQILMHWGEVREPLPGSLLFGPFPYSSGGAFSGKSRGDAWKPIPGGRLFGGSGSLFLVVSFSVLFITPQASHSNLRHTITSSGIPLMPQAEH